MANRKGLGASKKFANGTIHENGSGRFMILDRFADEDGSTPMLEFQWLSGDKERQTEINKEININSSIHKFQVSRGRPTVVAEPQRIEDNLPFMDKIDMMATQLKQNGQFIEMFCDHMTKMLTMQETQQKTIDTLTESVRQLTERNAELILKQQESLYKLIDKV
jgi:hypothetical protein